MEELDDLDKFIDHQIDLELHRVTKEEIGPYTFQFLKNDPLKGITPFASGVLAYLGGSHYILTASHVIEYWDDSNRLFIEFKKGEYVSVVGKGCGTEIEKKEKLDLAYIKLKAELVTLLEPWYKFLPIKRFLKHSKLLDEANYCVFGYPVANHSIQDGKLKTFGAAYYMAPHKDKVYEYYALDPLAHYILEFRGKATNLQTGETEKIKTEHYGLSGCGLWYTTINHDGKKFISHTRLIGIMTEFRRGKYDCLIANRIEILLASLHHNEGLKFTKKKL